MKLLFYMYRIFQKDRQIWLVFDDNLRFSYVLPKTLLVGAHKNHNDEAI